MAWKFWGAIIGTGNTNGCLDAISIDDIADADGAFLVDNANEQFKAYTYDSASTATPSDPDVIAPADYAGAAGRWVLTSNIVDSLSLNDNEKLILGTGDDVEFYFNGTDLILDILEPGSFKVRNRTADEDMLVLEAGGGASLSYDGAIGFELLDKEVRIYEDSDEYLSMNQQVNSWYIENTNDAGGYLYLTAKATGSGQNTLFEGNPDAQVAIFHNGDEKLRTLSTGIMFLPDSNSSNAIWLTGDGTDYTLRGYIPSAKLNLDGEDSGGATSPMAVLDPDADCSFYYDGSKVFSTTERGIDVQYAGTDSLTFNADDDGGWNVNSDGTGTNIYFTTGTYDDGASGGTITLNPDDKAAQLTLSNGNLTVLKTGANARAMVRATQGFSSGKIYFELTCDFKQAQGYCIGMADATATDLVTHVGFDANSWSWYTTDSATRGYYNGSYVSVGTGENFGTGDVIGCAVDLDNGKIFFCDENGTYINGADPVAGTGALTNHDNLSGTLYPAVSMYDNPDAMTVNFGASAFTHTPPTGYTSVNANGTGTAGGDVTMLTMDSTGAVNLYFTGTKEASTVSGGLQATNAFQIGSSQLATGMSGADLDLITGTAGTADYTALWNSDGDIVDGWIVDDSTLEISAPNIRVKADGINDTHIDWGVGANQVSAVDIPIADSGTYLAASEVETAIQEIAQEQLQHNLNGFEDASAVAISSDAGTPPTITLTFTGTVAWWSDGVRYTDTGSDAIQIEDTSGTHIIYYDGATLSKILDPTHAQLDAIIENKAICVIVYWETNTNTTPVIAAELHGVEMSGSTHHYLHDTVGAAYEEGANISGYTLNSAADADVSFDLTDLEFYDEDILIEVEDGVAANQYEQVLTGDAEIPVLYKDDVDGSWIEQAASTLPYILQGGDTYPSYNNDDGDGTWSLIELGNQKFMIMWLIATNDYQYPIKMVCGSEEYNTAALAAAGTTTEIIAWGGLPAAEFIILYQFVIQASAGGTKNLKITDINDYRTTTVRGTAAVGAADHGALGGLGDDDHAQYILSDGTRDIEMAPGSDWQIKDTDGDVLADFNSNGTVGLYNNAVLTASTRANGVTCHHSGGVKTGAFTMGNGIMYIYPEADNDTLEFGGYVAAAYKTMLTADPAGAVVLNYADATKLATSATGTTTTGVSVADGFTVGATQITDGVLADAGGFESTAVMTLADTSTMKTSAAPVADAQIANKKYVDDNDKVVAVDAAATAGYLGAANSDGVLRTDETITYTDGGDFVTLSRANSGPSFEATLDSNQINISVAGTQIDVQFDTETWDLGADFNTGTYTFTAPISGKYQFNVHLYFSTVDDLHTVLWYLLNTSNKNYWFRFDPDESHTTVTDGGNGDFGQSFVMPILADMDASDTAKVQVSISGGAAVSDINSNYTYFSGHLAS